MKSQLSRKITKLGENFNIKEVVTGFWSRTSFLYLNLMDKLYKHEWKGQKDLSVNNLERTIIAIQLATALT